MPACPVYNGLTDEFHPTQILADFLTIREFTHKHLSDITFCFLGDTACNVAASLMVGAAKIGMDIRLGGPKSRWPADDLVARAREIGNEMGARVTITESAEEAIDGVDFVYTDVWVSMGEPDAVWKERIEQLSPYRVTNELMRRTGNRHTKFMHCLPAFHNTETKVGAEIQGEARDRLHGGHRGGVRIRSIYRFRPSRKPDAHYQGRPGRHHRELMLCAWSSPLAATPF